jgi:glycosyltransferase involved in cell wall biosynthesis
MTLPEQVKPVLSVIVPVYNGSATVKQLYTLIRDTLMPQLAAWELLFVNDGSSDSSVEVIRGIVETDARVKLVTLSRNFGQQAAITAGIDYARGDAIAILDQDLQDPPAMISEFLDTWHRGYDIVYGVRTRRKESWLRKVSYHSFYRILRAFSDVPIPVDTGDFCLMDRRVVEALKRFPERTRFIRGMRAWVGFRQKGIPYERAAKTDGKSEYTLGKYFQLAADGLVAFSMAPLRLASLLGFAICGLSTAYALFVLIKLMVWGIPVKGFTALAILVAIVGGSELLTLGIVGEYLGRVFNEVRQRPFYLVGELVGNFPERAARPQGAGQPVQGSGADQFDSDEYRRHYPDGN